MCVCANGKREREPHDRQRLAAQDGDGEDWRGECIMQIKTEAHMLDDGTVGGREWGKRYECVADEMTVAPKHQKGLKVDCVCMPESLASIRVRDVVVVWKRLSV